MFSKATLLLPTVLAALLAAKLTLSAPSPSNAKPGVGHDYTIPSSHSEDSSHDGDDNWYDTHVAWTGACPSDGSDSSVVHYGKNMRWTDYATNGPLACGGRPADAKYNEGYFVAVNDARYRDRKCGHVVKIKKEGHADKCAVVIETGAVGEGLLLSPKFFREYEDLDTGIFYANWNFVNVDES